MPAGPLLAGLEVGLAGVHPGVEVAERLGDGLDPLPVHPRVGVDRARLVVVAGRVGVHERLRLQQQLVGLVLHVRGVVRLRLVDQLLVVRADRHLLVGLGDGEVGADALAGHPRLAGGDVLAGRRVHDELAGQLGADVLDLGDDAEPVLAEQVELGDLRAGVGDVEGQGAGRSLGRREVARGVRGADGQGARGARDVVASPSGGGVLGAGGESRDRQDDGEQQGGTHHDAWFLREVGQAVGAGTRGGGWADARRRTERRKSVRVGTT